MHGGRWKNMNWRRCVYLSLYSQEWQRCIWNGKPHLTLSHQSYPSQPTLPSCPWPLPTGAGQKQQEVTDAQIRVAWKWLQPTGLAHSLGWTFRRPEGRRDEAPIRSWLCRLWFELCPEWSSSKVDSVTHLLWKSLSVNGHQRSEGASLRYERASGQSEAFSPHIPRKIPTETRKDRKCSSAPTTKRDRHESC